MDGLISSIISATIGAGFAALGLIISNALNFRVRVDEHLREKRLEVYKVLWKKTSLLPKWPRNPSVTYEKLNEFSKELRDWYFNEGGVYLSVKSRKAYEVVQDRISEIVDAHQNDLNSRITNDKNGDYDKIREACSRLRTELTDDLQSRKRIFLLSR